MKTISPPPASKILYNLFYKTKFRKNPFGKFNPARRGICGGAEKWWPAAREHPAPIGGAAAGSHAGPFASIWGGIRWGERAPIFAEKQQPAREPAATAPIYERRGALSRAPRAPLPRRTPAEPPPGAAACTLRITLADGGQAPAATSRGIHDHFLQLLNNSPLFHNLITTSTTFYNFLTTSLPRLQLFTTFPGTARTGWPLPLLTTFPGPLPILYHFLQLSDGFDPECITTFYNFHNFPQLFTYFTTFTLIAGA